MEPIMSEQVPLIIPFNACRNHAYIYDIDKIPIEPALEDYVKGARAGFNVDFEFKEYPTSYTVMDSLVLPRKGVTGQISGILSGPAIIFDHPDHIAYAKATDRKHLLRHRPMVSEALFID